MIGDVLTKLVEKMSRLESRVAYLEKLGRPGGAWVDYSNDSTINGWSSFITKSIFFRKVGRTVFVYFDINGTSNSSDTSFTLPTSARATMPYCRVPIKTMESGVYKVGQANFGSGNLVLLSASVDGSINGTPFGATGSKRVQGQLFYEEE